MGHINRPARHIPTFEVGLGLAIVPSEEVEMAAGKLRYAVGVALVVGGCVGDIGDPNADGVWPGGAPGPGLLTCEDGAPPPEARLRRLSHPEYKATVEAILGLDETEAELDLAVEGGGEVFTNEDAALWVRDDQAAGYRRTAARLVERAVNDGTLASRWPCIAEGGEACGRELVAGFGRAAFRRPLRDDEVDRYRSLYQLAEAELGAGRGGATVVRAMLQSPHLIYRSERGPLDGQGVVQLTDHELASALSYHYTGAPPDAELAQLADRGELYVNLAAQAERLATDPRWAAQRMRFLRELFEVAHVAELTKDEMTFPEFAALQPLYDEELEAFLEDMYAREPTVGHLFDYDGELVPELAETYDGARRGLFLRGAFLASHSGNGITSPVTRGMVVRTRLLCGTVPPPPEDANTSLPEPEPGMSRRELIESATQTGSCEGCHTMINDLGFAFDGYNAVGLAQTVDDLEQPIDTAGSLTGTDVDGAFSGVGDLLDRLRDSDQVTACLTEQAFRYSAGRPAVETDRCATTAMVEASGRGASLNLERLLRTYPLTPSFRERQVNR
ncbi:MAG: DUF1588 domain-containing protein [Myxococcota bacterium]